MRSRLRVVRAAVMAGAALLGLVAAHIVAYVVLFRDPLVRAGLMRQTGHSYFSHFAEFAVVSALLATVGSFALGFLRARTNSSERVSTTRTWMTLALIQSGGFVALEAGERFAARALGQRVLTVTILGVLLQIVVACFGALLLRLLERTGEAVARALGSGPAYRPSSRRFVPFDVIVVEREILSRAAPRAPPLAPAH